MVRVMIIFLMMFSLSSCYNTGSMGGNFLVNTLSKPLQTGVLDALSGKHQNSSIIESKNDFNERQKAKKEQKKKDLEFKTVVYWKQLSNSCDGHNWIETKNEEILSKIKFLKSKKLKCTISILPDNEICLGKNGGLNLNIDRKNKKHYEDEVLKRGLKC